MSKEEKQKQMFGHVEQWMQSGLSQKEYALANNIKPTTMSYWAKRYRDSIDNKSLVEEFVELKPWQTPTGILIRYSNGIELSLPPQTTLGVIKELIGI